MRMYKVLRLRIDNDNETSYEDMMRDIVDDFFDSAKAKASIAEQESLLEANESTGFDELRFAVGK